MRTPLLLSCLVFNFLIGTLASANVLSSLPRSYYPQEFYLDVENGVRDGQLRRELFTILSGLHVEHPGTQDEIKSSCPENTHCYRHFSLGYNEARRILFGRIHLLQTPRGYAIHEVYCQQTVSRENFHGQPPAPNQIPDPDVLNAEHTWPQSRFSGRFPKDLQKSDLHILYPALSKANSSRSNYEFADVSSPISNACPESKRGYISQNSNRIYFEPPGVHKGNVARAIFYFAVRYNLSVSPEEENSLKAWHKSDPVDEDEIRRNQAIFEAQGNRNPFIDHPELVDLISDF